MIEEIINMLSDVQLDHIQDGPGGYCNVYLTFRSKDLSIADRGQRLMEIEDTLIKQCSPNVRVWHIPLGDKNSLRKLRGITVK